jgi:HEAT repeat protein
MAGDWHEALVYNPNMDPSVIFASQFAQLLWLLLHEPGNIVEQKVALRALLNTSTLGSVSLALNDEKLQANGNLVAFTLSGVSDVTTQMVQHGLALITMDPKASAADLLGTARILASMPVIGDGGAAAEAQRLALGATTVRFAARPRSSQALPAHETTAPDTVPVKAMEFGDVLDDPLAEARARGAPRATQPTTAPTESRGEERGLFAQFAATRAPTESHEALLRQLESSHDSGVIANALEDLVVLAEIATREGKAAVVSEILFRLGRRETDVEAFESKRAFAMTLRRLAKPEALRIVATQLPHDAERREEHEAVLARAGEDGADALIEQIVAVAHQRDRRIYFDALLRLKAGVPALLHMLSDTRWFVARNAAELLGEMQVAEAEQPLGELLRHDDDRVRRSATGALMRLGTSRAMQAIQQALTDAAPQTRMQAAAALVTRKDVLTSAPHLMRALDAEKDEEVQAAFLLALGKLATPEAVQRLISAAELKRGLFQTRTTTSFRVAAVNALAGARTELATSALRELQSDKDEDVRSAVTLALGRIARASQ